MHGKLQKMSHRSPFLNLELTQFRVYLFVLFFHALGCVLRICKETCDADIMGVTWPAGVLSQYIEFNACYNHLIGIMVRVFANGGGDLGSVPGRIIRKT